MEEVNGPRPKFEIGDWVDAKTGETHRGRVTEIRQYPACEPYYLITRESDGFVWIGWDSNIKAAPKKKEKAMSNDLLQLRLQLVIPYCDSCHRPETPETTLYITSLAREVVFKRISAFKSETWPDKSVRLFSDAAYEILSAVLNQLLDDPLAYIRALDKERAGYQDLVISLSAFVKKLHDYPKGEVVVELV